MFYFSVLIYVSCAGQHLSQVRGEQPLPQWRRPSMGKFFIFSLYIFFFLEITLICHRLLSDNLINQIINNTTVMFVVVGSKLLTLQRKKFALLKNLKHLWSCWLIQLVIIKLTLLPASVEYLVTQRSMSFKMYQCACGRCATVKQSSATLPSAWDRRPSPRSSSSPSSS
jgi:hypothetical protein